MHATSVGRTLRALLLACRELCAPAAQVRQAREAYGLPVPIGVAVIVLPWLAAVGAWMLLTLPATLPFGQWLIRENGIVENLTFASYVAAGILGLVLARRAGHRRESRRLVVFYAALSVLSLVLAMEEISWGQRLFHWASPGFLREANRQSETNFHNLPILDDLENWVILAIAAASIWSMRLFAHPRLGGFAAPSILVSNLIVMLVLAGLGLRLFDWPAAGSPLDLLLFEMEEILEMLLAFAALLYVWLNARMLARRWGAVAGATTDR